MGYILAIVIGVVLGLIGGGGSILAVPILVYVLGVNPIQATAYSLFIVGLSALIGARKHYQLGNINFKIGILFAAPSFIGVFLSRKLLLPAIPHKLLELNSFILFKDSFLMILFAILMLFAAYSMLSKKELNQKPINQINILKIILDGFIVGIVTGLVGAGGGFLIVPALILFSGLEMKKAIGISHDHFYKIVIWFFRNMAFRNRLVSTLVFYYTFYFRYLSRHIFRKIIKWSYA